MALIDARGNVLGKDELMTRAWPDRIVEDNSLQAQISTLRKVLGAGRRGSTRPLVRPSGAIP